jgi:hypothetical protein
MYFLSAFPERTIYKCSNFKFCTCLQGFLLSSELTDIHKSELKAYMALIGNTLVNAEHYLAWLNKDVSEEVSCEIVLFCNICDFVWITVYSTYNEIGFNEVSLITYILLCPDLFPSIFLSFYIVYNEICFSEISVTTYIFFAVPCIILIILTRSHHWHFVCISLTPWDKQWWPKQRLSKEEIIEQLAIKCVSLVLSVLRAKLSFRWWNLITKQFH